MFNMACKIPHDCYLAYSGGTDSSALLKFLLSNPKRKVELIYVIHDDYELFVNEFNFVQYIAKKFNLPLKTFYAEKASDDNSKEFQWSNERNNFYQILDKPVLTGHNLNDALEWHLITATRGNLEGKLMPIVNNNVMRPFIFTKKVDINNYINHHGIECFKDTTNDDISIVRNHIRHVVVPAIESINPGIYTSLVNKYKEKYSSM